MIGQRVNLPGGWRPPQTVKVTLMYVDGDVEDLWVCEAFRRPPGAAADSRWFLACGPAGRLVRPISRVFVAGLPPKGTVVLLSETDDFGEVRFRAPKHMWN